MRKDSISPRYGIQPKSYPNRAHQRYPVLVRNIPGHICWQVYWSQRFQGASNFQLQELKDFGRLAGGLVAYCDLDRNKNGRGFIEYLSWEDAEEAIRSLNGQMLGGQAVSVSAQPRPPRRSSRSRSPIRCSRSPIRRSRSPIRRNSYQIPDIPLKTKDEPRGRCVVPTSASRYSLRSASRYSLRNSPERSSSRRFTSPPSPVEPAQPVGVHLDLHPFLKAVDSYRSGLLAETVAHGTALMLQPTSYIDSSSELVAETNHDYYDFDRYLRLSYERRLQCLPGCYS